MSPFNCPQIARRKHAVVAPLLIISGLLVGCGDISITGGGAPSSSGVAGSSSGGSTTARVVVSGTITGLQGTGLVLQTHGVVVPIFGNTFSITLSKGSSYDIVPTTQPSSPTQLCTVANGAGAAVANVSNVAVSCVSAYSVSVVVKGMQNGARGLTVLDNGGDSLAVTGNGSFTFTATIASGQPYAVRIGTQPTGTSVAQYCIVPNGAGTVTNADVSVTLTCRNVGQALFAPSIYDYRRGNGDIVGFTINPANGNLTSAVGSPYAAGNQPYSIALNTQSQTLYALNHLSNDISAFSVSPTTGVLTGLQTAPGYTTSGGFNGGFSVLVDPQVPSFVYAGSDQSPQGLIDLFTATAGGVLSAPTPTTAGNDPLYMTIDPTGTLLFAPELFEDNIRVYGIGASGALTPVAGTPFLNGTGSGPAGVAVSPTGHYLYVAGLFNATVTAYSFDASGTLTALAPSYTFGTGTGAGVFPGEGDGLAIDPTGRRLYVTSPVDNTVSEYTIAAQTGLLTAVGRPVATGAAPSDVKIDPSGHYLYVSNFAGGTISEYVIDPDTGALTEASNSPFQSGFGTQSIAIE